MQLPLRFTAVLLQPALLLRWEALPTQHRPRVMVPGLNPQIPGPGSYPSQGLAVAPSDVMGLSSPALALAVCSEQDVLFQK